jgi:hypothetical protein
MPWWSKVQQGTEKEITTQIYFILGSVANYLYHMKEHNK